MKVTKELGRYKDQSFFFDPFSEIGICIYFVDTILGHNTKATKIKIAFSTNNPKKKGFRKVSRTLDDEVMIGDSELTFSVCKDERDILDDSGVKAGQSFWVKIDEV